MKNKKRSVFVILLAFIISMLSSFPVQASGVPLTDTKISPWARESVVVAYETGLISENLDLGVDYTRCITRLQFAHMAVDFIASEKNTSVLTLADDFELVFQVGDTKETTSNGTYSVNDGTDPGQYNPQSGNKLPELEYGSFLDTKSPYAELAYKLNIMVGSDNIFRPNDMLTRAEAAVVLQRCMAALNITEANEMPMSFTDTYAIPRWAVEAVKFVSGRTDGNGTALLGGAASLFSPEGTFTIEQAIITLSRMHDSTSVKNVCSGWRDAPGYDQVQIKLTFGGDCTFGRDKSFVYSRSFDEMYDLMGPKYFFSGIDEFFTDDLTMVNFEGTLTNATRSAAKTFVFKGRPEYAQILPAGSIDVVTVANNHSMDYLHQGYQDTIENLSPYVSVSGYDMMPIVTVKGINIGFASNMGWVYNESQKAFIRNAIQTFRDAGVDYIVFNFHWGIESQYHSNATQQAIAHYCIDQGADLVIGHHPHVTQETETYKGKQIVYSLGNLVFGGNQNPRDKNCLIFQQTITFDIDTSTFVSETHTAVPYHVSSVTYRNDYHPVRSD